MCLPPPAGIVAWISAENSPRESVGRLNGDLRFDGEYAPGYVGRAFDFTGICCYGWTLKALEPVPLADLTAEAWIQGDGVGQFRGAIASGGDGVFHFMVHPDGSLVLARTWGSELTTQPVLLDAAWHHVAVTRQGSEVSFFVDGTRVALETQASPGAVLRELTVGDVPAHAGSHFRGRIDEFALYDRALTPDEITALFRTGSSGKCLADAEVRFEAATDRVPAGAIVPVTLAVTNHGRAILHDVTVVSALTEGAPGSDPAASRGVAEMTASEVRWRIGDLTPSDRVVLTYRVSSAGTAGFLTHEARLASSSAEANVANNRAAATTELLGSCSPRPEGLAAWWAFEGNTYEPLTGTVMRDGEGGLGWQPTYTDGRVGRAIELGRSFGILLSTNAFSVPLETNTLECWVRRTRVDRLNDAGDPLAPLMVFADRDQLILSADGTLGARTSQFGPGFFGSGALRDTGWHHVALTRSHSTLRLYLDGMAAGSAELPPPETPFIDPPAGLPSGSFFGAVDELSIYRRALDESEIAAIHRAGGAGKCFADVALAFGEPRLHARTGELFRVSLAVTHAGVSAASNATVTMPVPEGIGVESVTSSRGTTAIQNGVMRVELGDLEAGAAASVSIEARASRPTSTRFQARLEHGGGDLTPSNDSAAMEVVPHDLDGQPPEGLLGWWPGEGTTDDALGRVSGETDGFLFYGAGIVGIAFDFSFDGALWLGNPAAWHVQNLTVEAWVRSTNPSGSPAEGKDGRVVFFGGGTGSYTWGLSSDGRMNFGRTGGPTGTGPAMPWDDGWHHLAVTKQDRLVTFYRDGQPIGTSDLETSFTFAHSFALGRPADPEANASSPNAWVDELALYGRALAADEIRRLANRSLGGKWREDLAIETVGILPELPVDEEIGVTLHVKNWGYSPAASVVLTGWIPSRVRVTGADVSQGAAVIQTERVIADFGTIPAESDATLKLRFRARQAGAAALSFEATRAGPDLTFSNNVVTFPFEAIPFVVSIPEMGSAFEKAVPRPQVVPVSFSVYSQRKVRVRYELEPVTATPGLDFTGADGEIVYGLGVAESIPLGIVGDTVGEDDEVLWVRLTEVLGAPVGGFECRITIVDDDPRPDDRTDTDADGMPDTWETRFGFDPSSGSDATLDPDGDGLVNRDEFLAGSSPTDPRSGVRIESARITGNQLEVAFQAVAGWRYRLESRTRLDASSWGLVHELAADANGPRSMTTPVDIGGGFLRLYVIPAR